MVTGGLLLSILVISLLFNVYYASKQYESGIQYNNNNNNKNNEDLLTTHGNINNAIEVDEEGAYTFTTTILSTTATNGSTNSNSTTDEESPYCEEPYDDIPRKSQRRAMFFSIFLGYLGVDRFYLGYRVTGVVKLFTLGGVGAWWIIDAIVIISSNLVDINGCKPKHDCCWE